MKALIFVLFAVIAAHPSYGQIFGPNSYEDCVLAGVKSASTEGAIGAVYQMCRIKFPRNGSRTSVKLPSAYLGTGRPIICTFERGTYQDMSFRVSYTKSSGKVKLQIESSGRDFPTNAVTQTNSRLIFSFVNNLSKQLRAEIDLVDGSFQLKDDRFIFSGVCEEIIK